MEWIVSLGAAGAIIVVGVLTYLGTRGENTATASSTQFTQASSLKDDYRESYHEMKTQFEELTTEVKGLRGEVQKLIRDGEMWRGVAISAFHDHLERNGSTPGWWPTDEPPPERV